MLAAGNVSDIRKLAQDIYDTLPNSYSRSVFGLFCLPDAADVALR